MMPTNCFSSLGCPGKDISSLCALAKKYGVENVELRSLEGKTDYVGWLADQPEESEKVAGVLAREGIALAVVGTSFNLTGSKESDIPLFIRMARTADRLGASFLRVFGGEARSTEELEKAARLYVELLKCCREEGVRSSVLVETHGTLVDSGSIRRLCSEAACEVPLLWDTHHTWKLGGETLSQTYETIAPLVRHIHYKDSRSLGEGGYAYVLPGQGEFPFAELKELWNKGPTEVLVSLEWEKQWHLELPELEEALDAWKNVAR